MDFFTLNFHFGIFNRFLIRVMKMENPAPVVAVSRAEGFFISQLIMVKLQRQQPIVLFSFGNRRN